MILTIVNMVCHTEKEQGYGLILRIGHPDLFVKRIVIVWMGIGIKKQHKEHLVGKRNFGKKATPCSNRRTCIEYLKHWLRKL